MPAPSGAASYLTLLVFAFGYLAATLLWRIPTVVGWTYLALSLACFSLYAWDKSRARCAGRRTPESALLFLGLACGWPGALLAQQLLRHKTTKAAFRIPFWLTVWLNGAAFTYFSSPMSMLRQL